MGQRLLPLVMWWECDVDAVEVTLCREGRGGRGGCSTSGHQWGGGGEGDAAYWDICEGEGGGEGYPGDEDGVVVRALWVRYAAAPAGDAGQGGPFCSQFAGGPPTPHFSAHTSGSCLTWHASAMRDSREVRKRAGSRCRTRLHSSAYISSTSSGKATAVAVQR